MKIISNFLTPELLENLVSSFEKTNDWKFRNDYYQYGMHGQNFSGQEMPKNDEFYRTSFERSEVLTTNPFVLTAVHMLGGPIFRCYRMMPGHGLRIHRDDYLGGHRSANIYLNRQWVWDWGGLLHVLDSQGESCQVVCPKLNTLTIIENTPHFVSPVVEWAGQPRYVLAVFGITA